MSKSRWDTLSTDFLITHTKRRRFAAPEKETEPDKTQIAFARIGRFFKYLNNKIMCRKPKREQETVVEDSPSRPSANNNTIANGEAHSEQKQGPDSIEKI